MCISVEQQKKILEHYNSTGQTELATLQKKSIESSIKAIEHRNTKQRSLNQNEQTKTLTARILSKYPSCSIVIRFIILVAVVFVIVVINKRKTFE